MSRRRKILYAIAIAGIAQYFVAMKLAGRLPFEPGELDDDDLDAFREQLEHDDAGDEDEREHVVDVQEDK